MRVVIDTNILLRQLRDEPREAAQNNAAHKAMTGAEEVVIPTYVFCETAWVMNKTYKLPLADLLEAYKLLLRSTPNININHDEVEFGMRMMELGGDFADGVIAYTGSMMSRNPTTFLTFDKKSVKKLQQLGITVQIPG